MESRALIVVALREVAARCAEIAHAVDVTSSRSIAQISVDIFHVFMRPNLSAMCFEKSDNLCVTVSRRVIEWSASPTVGAIGVDVALRYEKRDNAQFPLRRAKVKCRPA